MTNVNSANNSTQEKNKEKENTEQKKRNLWYVDVDLRKKFDLSFIEAAFYCMISQLQCHKEGFCWAKNYYFVENLGISDKWIEEAIKKLRSKGLIWVHYFMTRNGKRRQIVTSDSIITYQEFLKSHKNWILLKKFQEDFALIKGHNISDEDSPRLSSKKPQVTEAIPTSFLADGPSENSADAINTTYLPNKENDVTCKGVAPPAASDEACYAVVSLVELRKELESCQTKENVEIGMFWYQIQSDTKKESMQKPIAYVVDALKDGYAQEEVASYKRDHENLVIEKREKLKIKKLKSTEAERNKEFVQEIIKKIKAPPEVKCKIDSSCFRIWNSNVIKEKDELGGRYYLMPNGEKRYEPGLIESFSQPTSFFKSRIKEFLLQSLLINSEELKRILR